MRRRSLLAAALSLSLIALFVVVFDPARLAAELARTNLGWFLLGLVMTGLAVVCWSEGVRPLLADAGGPVSRWRGLVAYTAAMFGRQLVPMGAVGGPAITAFALDREVRLNYNETLAVVTVAEFLSTVASLVLVAVGICYLLFVAPWVPQIRLLVVVAVAFTAVLGALATAFWYRRRAVERSLLGASRLLQMTVGALSTRLATFFTPSRWGGRLDQFYETVDRLARNRRTVAVSLGLHQIGWLCSALPLYTSGVALGVELPLPLVFFLVPVVDLVAVLPLPGGLGGVELVLAGLLVSLGGVTPAVAAAVVVLYRLSSYWFLVAVGWLAAVYTTVSVRDLASQPGQ